MSNKQSVNKDKISDIMSNPRKVTQIIQAGIKAALLKHKLLGNPVCEWRDNQVVWIPADQISVDP